MARCPPPTEREQRGVWGDKWRRGRVSGNSPRILVWGSLREKYVISYETCNMFHRHYGLSSLRRRRASEFAVVVARNIHSFSIRF